MSDQVDRADQMDQMDAVDQIDGMARADRTRIQRRTIQTLMSAQVLIGATTASAVTVGALLAKDLTGRDALAGSANAAMTLGAAMSAIPLARQAANRGRRPVLVTSFLIGAVGSALLALSAATTAFAVLLVGMVALGVAQAGALQSRFAAGDLATDNERGRAIGLVLWATTIGSVSAPSLLGATSWAARGVGTEELVGSPVLGSVLGIGAAAVLFAWLRPDPLIVSGAVDRAAPTRSIRSGFDQLATNPNANLSIAAVVVAHLVMVGVMSMTALHLDEAGQSKTMIGFVFSTHIGGMYALSPVSGWLSDRLGRLPTIATGAVVLILSTQTAGHTAGAETEMMLLALFLLGFGWSLCLVAGSALLSESVEVEQRVNVQGISDVAMSSAGVVASVGSGLLKEAVGYQRLAQIGMVIALALLVASGRRWTNDQQLRSAGFSS